MILEIFSNHGGSMILWLFGHRLSILGSALWSQGLDSMILGDHYRISFQLRIFYYIFFYFCILTNKYSTWQSHRLSIARASCISPQTSKELERGWRKAESLKLLEHSKQWRFAFVHTWVRDRECWMQVLQTDLCFFWIMKGSSIFHVLSGHFADLLDFLPIFSLKLFCQVAASRRWLNTDS